MMLVLVLVLVLWPAHLVAHLCHIGRNHRVCVQLRVLWLWLCSELILCYRSVNSRLEHHPWRLGRWPCL